MARSKPFDLAYYGTDDLDQLGSIVSNVDTMFQELYTLSGLIGVNDIIDGEALTAFNDTNITLTLAGEQTTALLSATSITAGWTGTLSGARGGTGTGTYAIGDLLYADSTTSLARLADVATRAVLVSGGVGVAPAWSFTPTIEGLAITKTNTDLAITMTGAKPAAPADMAWEMRNSFGTITAPTVITSQARVGGFYFELWNGASYSAVASIEVSTDSQSGAPGANDQPTYINFFTTPKGSVSRVGRLMIRESGFVGINKDSPTSRLHVDGDIRSDNGSLLLDGDTYLLRDGANKPAFRNGTTAQLLYVYGTYTSGTNNERLEVGSNAGAVGANRWGVVATKGSGGGSARPMYIGMTYSEVLTVLIANAATWKWSGVHYIPDGNNASDFGDTTHQIRSTFIGTSISLGTAASATAKLHIAAGSVAASSAPIKLTSGTVMSTPEAGAIEFDGTNYYFTV